jgi:hypothetical protein
MLYITIACNDICPLFMRTCVLRVLHMSNYIFSPQLHLSNGKLAARETMPYVNGFPVGCCDHSSLMERDPN